MQSLEIMGCNGSLNKQIYKKNPETQDDEVLRAVHKNNFIGHRKGLISEFYQILKIIKSEEEYSIFNAREIETGIFRMIKEANKGCKGVKLLRHEIVVLCEIDHPNILKMIETIDGPQSMYIVYHYPSGDLNSRIKKAGQEVTVAKYIMDLLSAIMYLHKHEYIHGNIQLDNLALTEENGEKCIKLTGFNITRKIGSLISSEDLFYISPAYSAPELLQGIISLFTDMWSIGIIAYTLLVGKVPYKSSNKEDLWQEVKDLRLDFSNQIYQSLSADAKDFIKKLLIINPDLRMSAEEALNHVWIQQNRKKTSLTYDTVYRLKTFKVKSNIVRCFLVYYTYKANLKENEIVKFFKEVDHNFNGILGKNELVYAFAQVGMNVDNEIDSIMKNIDFDKSGMIDFTELKIVLTDWEREIKKKNIAKVFNVIDDHIELSSLKNGLTEIRPSEWRTFCVKAHVNKERVHVQKLKEFIRSNIE